MLGLFDWRAGKILNRKAKEGEKIRIKDIKDFPLQLWLLFIVCVTYYVTVFPFVGLATLVVYDHKDSSYFPSLPSLPLLFPPSFPPLSLIGHSVFLMDKYFIHSGQANILNSLVYLISAGVSPFIGFLVDKTGFNLFWCKYSSV